MGFKRMSVLITGLCLSAMTGQAQDFGKNKIQYRDFEWSFIQSAHFDVYYYEGGEALASFAADVAETAYVELKRDFVFDIEKRIPILVYNGHNDFQQTNVTSSLIEEGVGGFTEVFKDRVVIPFPGDYPEFRHVIHHELTHAVTFQIYYGGGMGSVITGMARFQLPLWFAEGLAEYESLGWDVESDMYIRDATLNNYVPPIQMMNGFMVYKGGQSLFNYIAERYGRQKIGEILSKARMLKNVELGFKQALGLDMEELSDRWHKYLQKTYWPDIQNRDEPGDISKKLTDHVKYNHFLNNSPAVSPKGDRLIYLTDRSDYIDIRMMDLVENKDLGRLIKGQRSDLFEEMHWLRPGMDWSPDGKRIVFAAKSGKGDELHVMDAENGKILFSGKFDLDGLFSPKWSPVGEDIVFMGIKSGQSDLYIYNLEKKSLRKLTDDAWSDLDPAWSPDGTEIAFVSDRPADSSSAAGIFDLMTIQVASGETARLTHDAAAERSPAFSSDGKLVAYISDPSGISNIYLLERTDNSSRPITNLVTGVSQLSWSRDGSRMVFSSFSKGGYDLFLITRPQDIQPGAVVLTETAFLKKQSKPLPDDRPVPPPASPGIDYRHFVFDESFRHGNETRKKPELEFLDSTAYKDDSGRYKTKSYKIRFSPDLVTGGAGYSQFYGIQGSSMIMLSDILGNHQISIYTDLFYNLKNSNFQFAYFYLPKRTDFGISVFHYSYLFYTYYSDGYYYYPAYIRDRNYGLSLYLSRPFSRFNRLDLSVTGFGIDRDYGDIDLYGFTNDFMHEQGNLYKRRLLLVNLGLTNDTVLWGETGPANGGRASASFMYSPSISKNYGLNFWTARADWRRYLRVGQNHSFVLRFAGGVSGGNTPQKFLLGGMTNWINYEYKEIDWSWANDMFYFSSFETPLRGALYYEQIGSRFVLANFEFRFPLVQYLVLGFPLPLGFQNIRGALFTDIGSAWDNDKDWRPFLKNGSSAPKWNDLQAGWGFGIRLNLGFFLLRYDLAWSTNRDPYKKLPIQYFSLGAEF